MGSVEPWNQPQIYFCSICKTGPGTQKHVERIPGTAVDGFVRTCNPCGRLLVQWRLKGDIRSGKKHRSRKPPPSDAEKEIYLKKRIMFLRDNPWCEVELKYRGRKVPSTHVHHRKGRGKYLCDETTFVATTAEGDKWIHANPKIATELGFLEKV